MCYLLAAGVLSVRPCKPLSLLSFRIIVELHICIVSACTFEYLLFSKKEEIFNFSSRFGQAYVAGKALVGAVGLWQSR